jgi:hypothetical protein
VPSSALIEQSSGSWDAGEGATSRAGQMTISMIRLNGTIATQNRGRRSTEPDLTV